MRTLKKHRAAVIYDSSILEFRFWILDLLSRSERRFLTEMISLKNQLENDAQVYRRNQSKIQNLNSKIENHLSAKKISRKLQVSGKIFKPFSG